MRLYVPCTLDALRAAVEVGVVEASDPVVAESDSEEDEYAAMTTAADLSRDLLDGRGRRVVLVAESASAGVFGLDDLVAIHADTEAIDPAADELPELGWFAVQELKDLIG